MQLKDFTAAFEAAKGVDASQARKESQRFFAQKDYMMAGIYAIIAGDYGASMFDSVLLALNEKEQTENIQTLLTEACRYNPQLGETHVLFVQELKDSFKGDVYAVTFNAVYNSGITMNDPLFTDEQIRWFASEGKTGYARKMKKRMAVNFAKRVASLDEAIYSAEKK
jgi:hypothetical protein